jgi:hypothetical protein
MSRAKYLTLITWLGQSAAARRFFFLFPFVLLATTARAPVVKSALVTVNSSPTAKKPQALDLPADGKDATGPISLFHSSPVDQPNDAPFVLRDTTDFKPILTSRDFPPVTVRPLPIAVTNDPLSPQPVTQFTPAGVDDGGLITRVFDTSDTAVAGEIAGFGSGFSVNDPIAVASGGGGSGTSPVGTAVPEPSCVWVLPAAATLIRRRRSLR